MNLKEHIKYKVIHCHICDCYNLAGRWFTSSHTENWVKKRHKWYCAQCCIKIDQRILKKLEEEYIKKTK